MISLSWSEIRWSIWAIRALIITSVFLPWVTDPARTSETKLLIRSLPRALPAASLPTRPSSTIESSSVSSWLCAAAAAPSVLASAIASSLQLRLELLHLFLVPQGRLQHLVQLLVGSDGAPQV